jgi:integrase
MQKTITKRAVDALKPGQILVDDQLPGFVCRRLPSGRLSYGLRFTKHGRRHWLAIGVGIAPEAARQVAVAHAGDVAKDQNPVTEREAQRRKALAARTLNDVLDAFVRERVKALRSANELTSLLDRFVRPKLGPRRIDAIKRLEIVELLDQIAKAKSTRSRDGKSRCVADKVLGVLGTCFRWHATRDDEFRSPIVAGMARTSIKELSRDRILSDDEIRSVWAALDDCKPDAFVRIVRALLLSGARLNEISCLQWPEIDGATLTVPAERVKTNTEHVVPITPGLANLIGKRGEDTGDFVFSTDGGFSSFSGFSKAKRRLDETIARQRKDGLKPMAPWRLHDLRRTARSLMARAGVTSDVAERVLGHVMPGVRGVYDRHEYLDEKRDALERLAALVEKIIEPPTGNVVQLHASR